MSDISHIQSLNAPRALNSNGVVRDTPIRTNTQPTRSPDRTDKLDLSDRALERLRTQETTPSETTPIRTELVQRIRDEIASNTYLTPDRLEKASQALTRALDKTA